MTNSPSHDPEESRRRIDCGLAAQPHLVARVHRALLLLLHSRGIVTVDAIHARARNQGAPSAAADIVEDNVQVASRGDDQEKRRVQEIVREEAARAFTPDEIDDVFNLALKREEARTLEEIANLSTVSFGLIAEKVKAFCDLPRGPTRLPESEALAVRVALIRHFISDQLEFIGVAKRHLTVRDFGDLVHRVIGTDSGIGRIGGKAAGLFLAERILRKRMFVIGYIILGLAAPLVLVVIVYQSEAGAGTIAAVGALLGLVGGLILRQAVLICGALPTLNIAGFEFRRIHRPKEPKAGIGLLPPQ